MKLLKTSNAVETDIIFSQVGSEILKKDYSPGAMARAIAESEGNQKAVESMYIRHRFAELKNERDAAAAEERKRKSFVLCPKCGHFDNPLRKPRGNLIVFAILLCVYIIPGLLYVLWFNGYKGVCSKCGKKLLAHF